MANLKHWNSLRSTNNNLRPLLEEKCQWINIVPVIKKEKMKKIGTFRRVRLGLSLGNILKLIQFVPKHVEYSQATKIFEKQILLNRSNLFFRAHNPVP